jgi:SAM-dependent methyltransferase
MGTPALPRPAGGLARPAIAAGTWSRFCLKDENPLVDRENRPVALRGHDGSVNEVDVSLRATSFGSAAEDYARYRPAPPPEAAEWALGRHWDLVIDVGAGTGNLTRYMAARSNRVVAVDLDPRMLTALGRRLPDVTRVVARGEVLPFRTGSAGVVAISSAWHWLDPDLAWPELARVIQPGGVLSVLWSGPDRDVPWVAEVLGHRRVDGMGTGDAEKGDDEKGARGRRRHIDVPSHIPFAQPERRVFLATVPFAVADMPGLAASYSGIRVLPEEERLSVMREVASRAAARPELAGPSVDLPLRCLVWRAVRSTSA